MCEKPRILSAPRGVDSRRLFLIVGPWVIRGCGEYGPSKYCCTLGDPLIPLIPTTRKAYCNRAKIEEEGQLLCGYSPVIREGKLPPSRQTS